MNSSSKISSRSFLGTNQSPIVNKRSQPTTLSSSIHQVSLSPSSDVNTLEKRCLTMVALAERDAMRRQASLIQQIKKLEEACMEKDKRIDELIGSNGSDDTEHEEELESKRCLNKHNLFHTLRKVEGDLRTFSERLSTAQQAFTSTQQDFNSNLAALHYQRAIREGKVISNINDTLCTYDQFVKFSRQRSLQHAFVSLVRKLFIFRFRELEGSGKPIDDELVNVYQNIVNTVPRPLKEYSFEEFSRLLLEDRRTNDYSVNSVGHPQDNKGVFIGTSSHNKPLSDNLDHVGIQTHTEGIMGRNSGKYSFSVLSPSSKEASSFRNNLTLSNKDYLDRLDSEKRTNTIEENRPTACSNVALDFTLYDDTDAFDQTTEEYTYSKYRRLGQCAGNAHQKDLFRRLEKADKSEVVSPDDATLILALLKGRRLVGEGQLSIGSWLFRLVSHNVTEMSEGGTDYRDRLAASKTKNTFLRGDSEASTENAYNVTKRIIPNATFQLFLASDTTGDSQSVLLYLCGAIDLLQRYSDEITNTIVIEHKKLHLLQQNKLLNPEREWLQKRSVDLCYHEIPPLEVSSQAMANALLSNISSAREERAASLLSIFETKIKEISQEITQTIGEATKLLTRDSTLSIVADVLYITPRQYTKMIDDTITLPARSWWVVTWRQLIKNTILELFTPGDLEGATSNINQQRNKALGDAYRVVTNELESFEKYFRLENSDNGNETEENKQMSIHYFQERRQHKTEELVQKLHSELCEVWRMGDSGIERIERTSGEYPTVLQVSSVFWSLLKVSERTVNCGSIGQYNHHNDPVVIHGAIGYLQCRHKQETTSAGEYNVQIYNSLTAIENLVHLFADPPHAPQSHHPYDVSSHTENTSKTLCYMGLTNIVERWELLMDCQKKALGSDRCKGALGVIDHSFPLFSHKREENIKDCSGYKSNLDTRCLKANLRSPSSLLASIKHILPTGYSKKGSCTHIVTSEAMCEPLNDHHKIEMNTYGEAASHIQHDKYEGFNWYNVIEIDSVMTVQTATESDVEQKHHNNKIDLIPLRASDTSILKQGISNIHNLSRTDNTRTTGGTNHLNTVESPSHGHIQRDIPVVRSRDISDTKVIDHTVVYVNTVLAPHPQHLRLSALLQHTSSMQERLVTSLLFSSIHDYEALGNQFSALLRAFELRIRERYFYKENFSFDLEGGSISHDSSDEESTSVHALRETDVAIIPAPKEGSSAQRSANEKQKRQSKKRKKLMFPSEKVPFEVVTFSFSQLRNEASRVDAMKKQSSDEIRRLQDTIHLLNQRAVDAEAQWKERSEALEKELKDAQELNAALQKEIICLSGQLKQKAILEKQFGKIPEVTKQVTYTVGRETFGDSWQEYMLRIREAMQIETLAENAKLKDMVSKIVSDFEIKHNKERQGMLQQTAIEAFGEDQEHRWKIANERLKIEKQSVYDACKTEIQIERDTARQEIASSIERHREAYERRITELETMYRDKMQLLASRQKDNESLLENKLLSLRKAARREEDIIRETYDVRYEMLIKELHDYEDKIRVHFNDKINTIDSELLQIRVNNDLVLNNERSAMKHEFDIAIDKIYTLFLEDRANLQTTFFENRCEEISSYSKAFREFSNYSEARRKGVTDYYITEISNQQGRHQHELEVQRETLLQHTVDVEHKAMERCDLLRSEYYNIFKTAHGHRIQQDQGSWIQCSDTLAEAERYMNKFKNQLELDNISKYESIIERFQRNLEKDMIVVKDHFEREFEVRRRHLFEYTFNNHTELLIDALVWEETRNRNVLQRICLVEQEYFTIQEAMEMETVVLLGHSEDTTNKLYKATKVVKLRECDLNCNINPLTEYSDDNGRTVLTREGDTSHIEMFDTKLFIDRAELTNMVNEYQWRILKLQNEKNDLQIKFIDDVNNSGKVISQEVIRLSNLHTAQLGDIAAHMSEHYQTVYESRQMLIENKLEKVINETALRLNNIINPLNHSSTLS